MWESMIGSWASETKDKDLGLADDGEDVLCNIVNFGQWSLLFLPLEEVVSYLFPYFPSDFSGGKRRRSKETFVR